MDESRKKRMFLIGAALIAVVSMLAGGYFTLRKGIYLDDRFFYRISADRYEHNRSNYIEFTSDSEFKIVTDTAEKAGSLRSEGNSLHFSFSDGASLTAIWNGQYLAGPDGLPMGWGDVRISVNNEPIELNNTDYCLALCRIYVGETESISAWPVLALGLLIYIFGVIAFLYPDKTHFLFRRWWYDNAELSDAGRFLERTGALLTSVLGILMMSGLIVFFYNH